MKIQKFSQAIEVLEARLAPAGLVTTLFDTATGALSVTGDAADNTFHIYSTSPTTFRVEGIRTSIDLAGFFHHDFVGELRTLSIATGAGADTIELVDLQDLKGPTAVQMDMGGGDDRFVATNLHAKGAVTLAFGAGDDTCTFAGAFTQIEGNLRFFDTVDGLTAVLRANDTKITGHIGVTGGLGTDELLVGGKRVKIDGSVNFAGAGGGDLLSFSASDRVEIGRSSSGDSIRFVGGADRDDLLISDAGLFTASGAIRTFGADRITISDTHLVLGKNSSDASIKVTNPDGRTDLRLVSLRAAELLGSVELDGGRWEDHLVIGSSGAVSIGKNAAGNSVQLDGQGDIDTLGLGAPSLTLAGGIEMNGGADPGSLLVEGDLVSVGKNVGGRSITYRGGGGADALEISGGSATLAGSVEMLGGAGDDRLAIDATTATIGETISHRSIYLAGGSGDDLVSVQAESFITDGSVELRGGSGNDNLLLSTPNISIHSAVVVRGDAGLDGVIIRADGTIDDMVRLVLGDDVIGRQGAIVEGFSGIRNGLQLGRDLVVSSTASAVDDSFTCTNVSVARNVDVQLGQGRSTADLDNVNIGGTFHLATNGGSDNVRIERDSDPSDSSIRGAARIELGTGNDVIRIGSNVAPNIPADHRVNFLTLSLDGGSGLNARNMLEHQNLFLGGAPAFAGLFTVVP